MASTSKMTVELSSPDRALLKRLADALDRAYPASQVTVVDNTEDKSFRLTETLVARRKIHDGGYANLPSVSTREDCHPDHPAGKGPVPGGDWHL